MTSSLWISFLIMQDGKTIKGSQIFEIKAEHNCTFRSLLDVFSESEGSHSLHSHFRILYSLLERI